jgi:hypothetical protein
MGNYDKIALKLMSLLVYERRLLRRLGCSASLTIELPRLEGSSAGLDPVETRE